MKSEDDVKKRVREVFYDEGKSPSHKNYLAILLVVAIIFVAAYTLLSMYEIVQSIWEPEPVVENYADVTDAISELGDTLANASDLMDDIGRQL